MAGIAAQADEALDLTETHITQDGAFQFDYPAEWTAEERPDGAVNLHGPDAFLTIYTPNHLAVTTLFAPDFSSATALMESYVEAGTASGLVEFQDSSKVVLDTGVAAVRTDFTFIADGATNVTSQYMLAVPVEDRYVLILVDGVEGESLANTVNAMAATFTILSDVIPTPGATQLAPPTDWRALVRLLESIELIDGSGELIWEADFASTSVGGPLLLPDDSESTYANIAGGALLSFRPDSQDNLCGFMVRVIWDEQPEQFLFVGVDAYDYVIVMDLAGANADGPNVTEIESEVPFFGPQQILYVLRDNHVTVLVNGSPVIEDAAVALPEPNARGEAAPGLAGAALENSCVLTDAWAYGFSDG